VLRAEGRALRARRDPVHGDVDGRDRVGARHGPVAARCERGPGRGEFAEGVVVRLGVAGEEGERELVELVLVARPQRLHVGGGAERGEAGDVLGAHDLQVREVVAVVGGAVG
jgi:hypothetical protein